MLRLARPILARKITRTVSRPVKPQILTRHKTENLPQLQEEVIDISDNKILKVLPNNQDPKNPVFKVVDIDVDHQNQVVLTENYPKPPLLRLKEKVENQTIISPLQFNVKLKSYQTLENNLYKYIPNNEFYRDSVIASYFKSKNFTLVEILVKIADKNDPNSTYREFCILVFHPKIKRNSFNKRSCFNLYLILAYQTKSEIKYL